MEQRVFNFSAGPAVLPVPVLEQIRDEMLCLPGAGASVLEISHRGAAFTEVIEAAEAHLRKLLDISDDYAVLFLQGGSRLQFSMIPMNLMGSGQSADYILTGSWGKKALAEGKKQGPTRVAYTSADHGFDRIPADSELDLDPQAAYCHVTSNETIEGVQFAQEPAVTAPLICDASSDFLHRKIDINKYGLVYACAQKNVGPAGVTVVVVRKDLVERSNDDLPSYLSYKNHVKEKSLGNTPPTFGVYVVKLVAEWLLNDIGGLDNMFERNTGKAKLLYEVIDSHSDIYQGHARPEDRSVMNVTWRLPSDDLTKRFLAEAKQNGLDALKGHRSVGGIRASIYNAMPVEGVEALARFMKEFAKSV